MILWRPRPVIALLLFVLGAPAQAVPVDGTITAGTDETGGRSFGADFSLSPGEHVTLSAGAGHVTGSDETSDLTGTLLDGSISLHGEHGGFSLAFDSFDDSSNYQSRTLAARGSIMAGDFEFALLGRRREISVNVTLELPLRTLEREAAFAASGAGLEIGWSRATFDVYASALAYDYDDDFDKFIQLADSPELTRRPRIEALVGTFLTQAQGAVDRQYGLGVERAFGRHSLALDLSSVHDAVVDAGSTSIAVTWRYAQSARLDLSLTAGLVDSATYGDIGFLSAGIGIGR
jgi:hypothetical protein